MTDADVLERKPPTGGAKWKPVTVKTRNVVDASHGKLEVEWILSADATDEWAACLINQDAGDLQGFARASGRTPLSIADGVITWDTYNFGTLAQANDHVRALIKKTNEYFPLFVRRAETDAHRQAELARRRDAEIRRRQIELDQLEW